MTSFADRTHDGKAFRMLCIIDEFSRESLAIRVARKLKATDVIEALCELFVSRGIPAHIRSDNGPEFVAQALRDWIVAVGAKTAYIEPGSPWENGYCESFNGKLRDELLNGEISLHPEGGTDPDRKLAAPLQYGASALIAGISTASTRSSRLASLKSCGADASSKLTFQTDHFVGAGH
jgi:transposase InsO family protein